MAIKEIRKRIVTCDRCQLAVETSLDERNLPEGWKIGYLSAEALATTSGVFCPKHAAGIEEAMRPLKRVR